MKTLCYSVRLESLVRISDKAFKAVCFDGSSDIIPASQVFGRDFEVQKSDAYWISAWILEKKKLTYSTKKKSYFYYDEKTKEIKTDEIIIIKHRPEIIEAKDNNIIQSLKK